MEIEWFLAQFAGAKQAEGEGSVQERHLGRKMKHGSGMALLKCGLWEAIRLVCHSVLHVCTVGLHFTRYEAQKKWTVQQYVGVNQETAPRAAHLTASCLRPSSTTRVLEAHCSHWPLGIVLKLSVAGLHSASKLVLTGMISVVGWVVGTLYYWHPAWIPAAGMVILEYGGCLFLSLLQLDYYKPLRKWLLLINTCVLDNWRSTSTLFHDNSRSNQMHVLGSRHIYLLQVHLFHVISSVVKCIGNTKKIMSSLLD